MSTCDRVIKKCNKQPWSRELSRTVNVPTLRGIRGKMAAGVYDAPQQVLADVRRIFSLWRARVAGDDEKRALVRRAKSFFTDQWYNKHSIDIHLMDEAVMRHFEDVALAQLAPREDSDVAALENQFATVRVAPPPPDADTVAGTETDTDDDNLARGAQ